MIYVAHRINTVSELVEIPFEYGVEIDVRDYGNDIVLSHDPFIGGELLDDYLSYYNHALLVVNVKSERLENRVAEILESHNVSSYFFLDSSMSTIFLLSNRCKNKFSGRYSEYESMDTVILMNKLIKWVWVDCFTRFVLDSKSYNTIKNVLGINICLTSPDLLGRPDDIKSFATKMIEHNFYPDAICCKLKNIATWKAILRL